MRRPRAFLTRHSGKSYAVVRIIVGLLFACHGAQKLFGVLGGRIAIHSPLRLAAGLIEFVAGTLVAVGFCGRAAAFLASGEMAVAYFTVCAGRFIAAAACVVLAASRLLPTVARRRCSIVSFFFTFSFTAQACGASTLFGVAPTTRSNQAMQLTAPQLVFLLSVATTFYSQPSTLSVAIADLVSR